MTIQTRSLDFLPFKNAVAKQFFRMNSHTLFRLDVSKDDLKVLYLTSFPAGTDPMFRERTEHDCNCCKSFIGTMGGAAAYIEGQWETIWDIDPDGVDPAYLVVAKALSEYVKCHKVRDYFFHDEPTAGKDQTFEEIIGGSKTWRHFFVNLPSAALVRAGQSIGTAMGKPRDVRNVMLRGLKEITNGAINTTLDLISSSSIYRGEEFRHTIASFQVLKNEFDALATDEEKETFAWVHSGKVIEPVATIRNTAIGTLLTDLSEGMPLERAVAAFEAKVAPTNYRRTTALVSKQMIEMAKATITKLGLMSALERRYATLRDITINNVLFADRTARSAMGSNAFDAISAGLPTQVKNVDNLEEVGIDKFLSDILPRAKEIEVLIENRHQPNFVTLIAPVDPTAGQLLKWDNGFSWDYISGTTDSVKERVKAAGGNITGDVRFSLAWYNYDDLDLHMTEPNGFQIYFGTRKSEKSGGTLDVDMNAGGRSSRTAVENIVYKDRSKMPEGVYKLMVTNFQKRESIDVGFEVEYEFMGVTQRFVYGKAVPEGTKVIVMTFAYTHKDGIKILESLPSSGDVALPGQEVWGVKTQTFQRVNAVMLSPNYWDGQVGLGNKHYFFMLQEAHNDGAARGFYNEFIKNELEPHRKALELVGAKMLTNKSAEQLSGIGFSTTQRNHAVVRVKTDATSRQYKVAF